MHPRRSAGASRPIRQSWLNLKVELVGHIPPSEAGMNRERRQYVRFAFYKVSPDWRRLPQTDRSAMKAELAELIESWEQRILLRTYSTIGTRADCDFMVWQV